ncbi:hypothetical protein E2C01_002949 [Portunus trituberculatus]|uniref:Uncharacterized protein n=1 Tax=Portunus trituberculatus TaxID=210409 RepID=A0A5B7CM46_PORTR|nr:hypothetical protein [Portunus trituberculatus]
MRKRGPEEEEEEEEEENKSSQRPLRHHKASSWKTKYSLTFLSLKFVCLEMHKRKEENQMIILSTKMSTRSNTKILSKE